MNMVSVLDDTKIALAGSGILPSKRMGQNFIVDPQIVRREVRALEIEDDDSILEIGGGTGTLTKELASKAEIVYTVEKDAKLARYLEKQMEQYPNVEVIQGDVLKVPLPEVDRIIGNVPYSVCSQIMFRVLEESFERAVFILQEEFAFRLVAGIGFKEYSRLSVKIQLRMECEPRFFVPREAFFPVPDVNSMCMAMTPRENVPAIDDPDVFHALVDAVFTQRRKKMKNAMKALSSRMKIKGGLKGLLATIEDHVLDRRPEQLSPEEFVEVANQIADYNQ